MAVTFGPSKFHPSYAVYFIPNGSLGDPVLGGYLICKSGGIGWIVAPASSEVSRTWYCRDDANTVASACTLATGWFVPTCGQLQNPGYCCRTYWDSYSPARYWSSTNYDPNPDLAWFGYFNAGFPPQPSCKTCTNCVRAFRCVTY